MEEPSSELQVADESHRRIRKAFNLLKSHASAVASFTLQWQDLEDHLNSIQNAIQSATFNLQNPNPNPNPSPKPKPSHFLGIPIGDGAKLLLHLKGRAKDLDSVRDAVRGALGAAGDPARLVLAAVGGFFPPDPTPAAELVAVRKCCVLLLEELARAAPEISADVRAEAAGLAAAWKEKTAGTVNSMESMGFLMLLSGYGLVGEFDWDEIMRLFCNVAQRKQAVELFRSLGLSDKANDFIQHLISQKKNTEALRFIYAFEMVNKFAPIPLLHEHVNEAKKASKTVWKNAKSSPKEKDDATNNEVAALRSVIKCIEEYKLESEYSPESLKERIEWLKNQKKERKAKEKMGKQKALAPPKSHAPQLTGNKRPFSDTGARSGNPPNRNKHPRAGPSMATAVLNPYARPQPAAVHPLHHRPAGSLEGERREYPIPSAVMPIPSMHHRPVHLLEGEGRQYLMPHSANLYSAEASHYHPPGSFVSPEAQYSPSHYSLSRSALEIRTSLPPGSYASAGSPTQRVSMTGGYNPTSYMPDPRLSSTSQYGLAGSDANNIDSLVERYGQFRSSRAQPSDIPSSASPLGSLAYHIGGPFRPAASQSERPAPSGGNYDVRSNSSYAPYHV